MAVGVLIGTRLAALLPHPNLETIFLVRSSHSNHQQADQNPRYDSRRLAELSGANIVNLDVLPGLEDLSFPVIDLFNKPETELVWLS